MTPSARCASSSSACRSPRRGATATRPPTAALVRELARARPRRAVPRARRALVRRATATCPSPPYGRTRALRERSTSCSDRFARDGARRRPGDRRLLRAGGRRASATGCTRPRAGVDRVLRHRHAGHAREARARRRATTSRRELIPRYDLYLSFTGGPTLSGSSASSARRGARPLYCSVDPRAVLARGARRRAGTSATSAPTAPTGSRRSSGCCSSRRGSWPRRRASSSPGRSTRRRSRGRPTSSASSTCRRPSTARSTTRSASR